MSDGDDQDKTRIQPRMRSTPAPTKLRPTTDSQSYISAPRPDAGGYAKTESVTKHITESRKAQKAPPADLLKGRFVLERILGAGGMGVVYKAKDLLKVEAQDRDPYVAIKVLGEEFKSHPEAFIALQRESRKTQRIAHPNIVNVHDFDKDGDTVFMTMEYLEGTPLDKVIKKYRGTGLPKEEAWQILEGICAALAYAHDQRLIHSDLKPGNIFVTNAGLAKVFDFGIARAVAKAEQGDEPAGEDRTVFDAGNLGALTPTYASLEMLEGDPPDVRDDIYALGVIAYELFAGTHPFKRKNAKEAFRKGLKPARIKGLSKRQWKAIEGALALEREQRVGTVQEFWDQITKKTTGGVFLWLGGLIIIGLVAFGNYAPWNQQDAQPAAPQISEDEYRSEIETKIRLQLVQENLADLFKSPGFDARWEAELKDNVDSLAQLLGNDHAQTIGATAKAYREYVKAIEQAIAQEKFNNAKRWILSAKQYTPDDTELVALSSLVEDKLAEQERMRAERLAAEKAAKAKAAKAAAVRAAKPASASTTSTSSNRYDKAYASVREQLKCNQLLDLSGFERAIKTMRSTNSRQYARAEPSIVQNLADCITRIARNFPEDGIKTQRMAQNLFGEQVEFAHVGGSGSQKDNCKESLAGLGSRGRRSRCQDILANGIKSPLTVVIPASGNIKAFAIGRYEVSVAEFNQYCLASGSCKSLPERNTGLPATNIPYSQVQGYFRWLSEQSGKVYRLPTKDEWTHAASARGSSLDSNRNCTLNVRGIQKGGTLVQSNIGQQNGWGVVNYVGNAREWVTDGGDLLAMGGSFDTDMEDCTPENASASGGEADEETGFRVLRELQ